jgi:porin
MRFSAVLAFTFVALLGCWLSMPTRAQERGSASNNNQDPGLTTNIRDPEVLLRTIRQRRETPPYSLFPTSPLTPLRERALQAEKRIYEATDIKLGTTLTTLLQGLSDEMPGEDDFGMATAMSMVGTWDGYNKGEPNQGELTFELQGRWDWGTTAPNDLGNLGLGSLGFTSNQFAAYTPTFW